MQSVPLDLMVVVAVTVVAVAVAIFPCARFRTIKDLQKKVSKRQKHKTV